MMRIDNNDDEGYVKNHSILQDFLYMACFKIIIINDIIYNCSCVFIEPEESREKIIAAEKLKAKELIIQQFALRRDVSKEDKVSLL